MKRYWQERAFKGPDCSEGQVAIKSKQNLLIIDTMEKLYKIPLSPDTLRCYTITTKELA